MERLKHIPGDRCHACDQKLLGVHVYLREWFWDYVKPRHPETHVSCGYRGEEEQEEAFLNKRSKARWPHSRHNHLDRDGNPCSYALDLFFLTDGKASFPWNLYEAIAKECEQRGDLILWGGNFQSIKDGPHFEYAWGVKCE